jgi:DNA-binding NtrC family response regulator
MARTLPMDLPPDTVDSSTHPGRILVIDDEPDIRDSLEALLASEGFSVELAANAADGLRQLDIATYDLVILDLMLPDKSGMQVLEEIRQRDRETPILMLTAYGSVEVAVQALKRGASDYFSKPWDNEKLLIEIQNMISKQRLERENAVLKRALKQRYSFPNIVGKSERMQRILDMVGQVSQSRATVLITGEAGTGKELIAHAIHANSARAEHPFVAVHSGSVSPELLEAALFGQSKGATVAAVGARKGYLDAAHRGTIFFDEVATLSLEAQTKLLRVMQEREFLPLGAAETVKVDVRIVAATNMDLKKLVDEGRFREDLLYRLNVIQLALPPLRDRKEDVPELLEHFFAKYCRENEKFLDDAKTAQLRFDAEAMRVLMDHAWPGNVRELEHVVERAVVLASQSTVSVDVLPEYLLEAYGLLIRRDESGKLTGDASLFEILADFERRTILDKLEACEWSQTAAAEAFRVPLSTLNQKIKRLNIEIRKRSTVN